MAGVGPVYEMLARLRFIESLKRGKKGYFTIAREYRKTLSQKELTYTACSEADLKEIRESVRAHYRDLFRKRLIALAVVLFVLFIVISLVLCKQ